jgi:hypothetical protein
MAVSANRLELLQIADAVAREKVRSTVQIVLACDGGRDPEGRPLALRRRRRHRAEINPKSGEIRLSAPAARGR